jgi:hypothetical protein
MADLKFDAFNTGQQTQEVDLPPAGYQRDEVLKQRTDALQQQIEESPVEREAIPHDADALNPDRNREVRYAIANSYLEIGKDHPYYITKWVNRINLNGQMVWQARAEGWKVATLNEFPEARELVQVDGSICAADVMLMYMRMDEHLALTERQEAKRLKQQLGLEADIYDLANRVNSKEGKAVFANVQTPNLGGIDNATLTTMEARAARKQLARQVAARAVGNRLKNGTL